MIILNTERCAEIASDVIGERVEVLLEVDPGCLGLAWKTESGDRMISVSPFQQPHSLLHTFWHEVAHHALGHLDNKLPRSQTRSHAEIVAELSAEVAEHVKAARVQKEQACDDLAESIMAALGPEAWRELLIDTEQDNA